MKNIVLLVTSVILMLQLFVSSAGVLVDHHQCSKDGDSFHLFFSHEEVCGNHLDASEIKWENTSCSIESTTTCCSNPQKVAKNIPSFDEPACCSIDVYHLQLDTDVASNEVDQLESFSYTSNFNDYTKKIVFQQETRNIHYRGPPAPTTLQKLAQLQSYLI